MHYDAILFVVAKKVGRYLAKTAGENAFIQTAYGSMNIFLGSRYAPCTIPAFFFQNGIEYLVLGKQNIPIEPTGM
jgi:hypothetical protein